MTEVSVPGRHCILVIGTCDTKSDELQFVRECLDAAGGSALIMDVGVLGEPSLTPDITNREVVAAAGSTLEEIVAYGDENLAMAKMAEGAARLSRGLVDVGRVHGVMILGGTMGTDLALDVAAALPLGVPKFVVSTISFSHLVPPERIAPDLMMILWSGGLYGLNTLCRTILGQAAGAVLGACRTATPPRYTRPLVGITSLGKSCLSYMVRLKPALEARGYEVAVFHTTGMGGRAFEALAEQGKFAAVMDFSLQEISNQVHGSVVNSGAGRLEAAGRAGIPQIIAPGATDMIDLPAWRPLPEQYQHRPCHAHNRLIASVMASIEERRQTARRIVEKLNGATGPVTLILPRHGIQEWDRPGEALHDPDGLAALFDEVRTQIRPPIQLLECDAHINDAAFTEAALAVFDAWVRDGIVRPGIQSNER
ncbi:MAG TPA: Tm-1-like ATP-binding domain-containing protein [Burkholderiaceae bacterium]|nr:Tm-1-like ATP-binding domain-containing protein [Burkholderiaceae bacterium]